MKYRDRNIGNDNKVPKGVVATKHSYFPGVDSAKFGGLHIRGHPTSGQAFGVTPSHKKLPPGGRGGGGIEGIVFAVEDTVADETDKAMPVLSRKDDIDKTKEDAVQFYENPDAACYGLPEFDMNDIKVEQASRTPQGLVYAGGHGFLAAVLTAFARHLPLTLGPDQVWALISFAFAKHVDKHAEELRHHFVSHQGKKRLVVEVPFRPSGDPETGEPPETWEDVVFPDFSSQIGGYIGVETHQAIAGRFTTTTKVAQAAHEVTLMSAMKNYFSYGMSTACGIPKITLLGSEADWTQLRARAEALGSRMTTKVRDMWLPKLLSVLDQFVSAYRGDVHHGFWQSMVKMRHKSAMGSGESSADYITGWVQIFYPYLKNGNLNRNMVAWEHCYWDGPKTSEFPSTLSSAPVDWDGLELHFHAGITGFTQDPADGALCPVLGWQVTHDPEKDPKSRIKNYKKEIEALRKGMAENYKKEIEALRKGMAEEKRVEEGAKPLSWQEQDQLTATINELPEELLHGVIQIIREAAGLGAEEDEIEFQIGIDDLDVLTQRKLLRHVTNFRHVKSSADLGASRICELEWTISRLDSRKR